MNLTKLSNLKLSRVLILGGALLLFWDIYQSCNRRYLQEQYRDYKPPITQDTHNANTRQSDIHAQECITGSYTNEFNRISSQRDNSEVDYYQDNLDYYWDDPEDEIIYPPEIFEAWSD